MVSIKLKFRPSVVEGREGTLYYQVICRRRVCQLSTAYKILPCEWDAEHGVLYHQEVHPSRSAYLTGIVSAVRQEQARFWGIVRRLSESGAPLTVDALVAEFRNRSVELTLFGYMEKEIERLRQHGQNRTSETYCATLNSFRNFRDGKNLSLEEMNLDMLMGYERYLRGKELSQNTISFYMKRLRAVYHKAVEEGIVEEHPLFRRTFTSSEKTVKRAVTLKTIRMLKDLDLSGCESAAFARDMFLFSFYTRGMSFVDIACLRKKDLKNNVLTYRRKKTGQQLAIRWEPCMKKVVDDYAAPASSPYLLSIIEDVDGNVRKQCHAALTLINRHLKKIGYRIGLSMPLTMYVARHSWASIARKEGVPLPVISEGMGHESERTTQIYLASLEANVIDRANKKILGLL